MDQTSRKCKRCGTVLATRQGTSHIFHLILSVITCGLWLPVWALSCVKIGGWRCSKCGGRC